jgi:hypothetical protein
MKCCPAIELTYGQNIGCIGIIKTQGLIDLLNALTGVCFIEVTSKTIDHFFIYGQIFKIVFSVSEIGTEKIIISAFFTASILSKQ